MYTIFRPPSTILRCLYSPIQFSFFVYDLNPFATLKLQIIVVFKPWEEKLNLAKKQAKKVKVSSEEKKRIQRVYRNASIVRSQGKKGGYCACQVGNWD
jgi:hypothetical protein